MGKITKSQQIECLFGHHDFFAVQGIRQCRRCKMIQVFTRPNKKNGYTKYEWCNRGIAKYDLEKEILALNYNEEKHPKESSRINDIAHDDARPEFVTDWTSTHSGWFIGGCTA